MARPARDPEERFWTKVEETDACWLWTGGTRPNGYGRFWIGSRTDGTRRPVTAHRYAYEITHGPIPRAKLVLHTCDVKLCVNPSHLYVGTDADNARDREERHAPYRREGGDHPKAKLTQSEVSAIRTRYARGDVTQSELGKEYGVSRHAIGKVTRGERWRIERTPLPPVFGRGRRMQR